MAQNEYDVNIKLNLEDSANSFSKRISEIDSELSKKKDKWRKEYQKSIQGEDLTDEARIYGQIRYVNQKQSRAWSYKRLEKERGSLVTAKQDSKELISKLNSNGESIIDTKTLDKLVEENFATISNIVSLGQKYGTELKHLESAMTQVKAKREQLKSFEKMDVGSDSYKKKVSSSSGSFAKKASTSVQPVKKKRDLRAETISENADKSFDYIMENAKKYNNKKVLNSEKVQQQIRDILQQQESARMDETKITLPGGKYSKATKKSKGRDVWGYVPGGEEEEGKGSLSTRFSSAALFEDGRFFNPIGEDGKLKSTIIVDSPALENKGQLGGVGDLRNASLSELEGAYSRLLQLADQAEQRGGTHSQNQAAKLREFAEMIPQAIQEALLNTKDSDIVNKFAETLASNKKVGEYESAVSEEVYAPYRNSPLAKKLRDNLSLVADQGKMQLGEMGQDTFTSQTGNQTDPAQIEKDARVAVDKLALQNKESAEAFEALKSGLEEMVKDPEGKAAFSENLDEYVKAVAEQILNLSGIDTSKGLTNAEIEQKMDRKVREEEDISFVSGDIPKYKGDEGDSRETLFDVTRSKNDRDLTEVVFEHMMAEKQDAIQDSFERVVEDMSSTPSEKQIDPEEEKFYQTQLEEQKQIRAKRVAGGDEDWQRMQDAIRMNQGERESQTGSEIKGNERVQADELVTSAKNRLQWLSSFVQQFDREDLSKIIDKVSTGGMSNGMDVNTIGNTIAKVLTYPEILMSSLEHSRTSLNTARVNQGLEEIDADSYKKSFFAQNPELEQKYNESLAAKKRFFNNDTGEFDSAAFSDPEEAIQRFFNVEGQIETGINKLIAGLSKSYENLEGIQITRSGTDKKGNQIQSSDNAQDWVKRIVQYRTDPSGRAKDPDAGLNRAFYSNTGIKGEDVNWSEVSFGKTPALKTGLQYKAGLSGAIYGGATPAENVALAQKKLEELEKSLQEFQSKKDELIKKQDEIVDTGIDEEVESFIAQLNDTETKVKEISSEIEMHKQNITSLEDAQKPSSYKQRKKKTDSENKKIPKTPPSKNDYALGAGGSFTAKNNAWGEYSGTITSISGEGTGRVVKAQVNREEKTFTYEGLQKQITSYQELTEASQKASDAKEEEAKKAEEVKTQIEQEKKAVETLNQTLNEHEQKVQDATEAEQQKVVISKELVDQLKNNETKAVEQATEALDNHSKPSEKDSVKLKYANIKSYDDKTHTYTDDSGKKLTSLTTLAGYLKGKTNSPTFNEDTKRIREVIGSLGGDEVLTPEKVGMNTKDFKSMSHTLAAMEQGNLEHEVIDLLAKTGAKSIDELRNSDTIVESKWGADGKEMSAGQTRQVKASEEYARVLQEKAEFLRKLGVEDVEQKMLTSTEAYLKALDDLGIDLTKFSEIPMAATLTGSKGTYSYGFTPDQVGINALTGQNYILDSKTGKTYGNETFQLAGQKFGILANKDNPEFQEKFKEIYKDQDFETYIAKIDGQFTQLIEHMGLSLEEFYDLVVRAFDISKGNASPLTSNEQKALMNRELQTGRIGALNTTPDGKTQTQNLTLGGGEFVSYGNGKKETALISKYLSEYQKQVSIGKDINALQNKINELAKDGTSASQEELQNLKAQLEEKTKAYSAQKEYMQTHGLEKAVDQAGGQSQTRIGNVVLSAAGSTTVKQKSDVIKYNAQASNQKNIGSAQKTNASEQKKALNNAIDRQKTYNALIQEEYELTRKIQGSSGDKQVEQQVRLGQVRQELQAYSEMSTKIENGQLIGQQADKLKLLDQLSKTTYLSEQDRAKKEKEILDIYSQQQAKLQSFKIANANSAGSNQTNTNTVINKYLKSLEQVGTLQREKARLQMKGGSLTGMQAIENRNLISNYDRQINSLQNQYSFKQLADGRTTLNGIELTEEQINKIEQERGKILDRNNAKMAQTQETVQQTKGFLEKLKENFMASFQQIGSYLMSIFSFQGIQRAFSSVIQRTSELDSKMVDLQIASGYTRSEITGMMSDFNKLGKQIGKTTSEIAEAANDWLRAGYSGNEVTQLTESSMNLATLGMINSADATSYLISVLKGWKLEASDIDSVVDKLVKTDMAAAISAGDLAEAMSRANNSAQIAGSSLDRYIGYLTTMTDVTQKSAASIGESMKTVYSRYQNIAAGKFVAAESDIESENYNPEDWANLNDVEKALGALGINIRDSVDNFRKFDDVMDEIASKWQTYSDVQKSGITTALAGTRQRENVLTMFENYDLVKKYEQIAANSYGTAAQKMEAYTDSVEAARQRITNSVEKFVLALNSSTALKTFYNNIADLTSNIYALSAAVTAFLLLFNTNGTVGTFINGIGAIQQKAINFSLSQIKLGQQNIDLRNGGSEAKSYWGRVQETVSENFIVAQKEAFSNSMTKTIDGLDTLQEGTRAMLKDGILPLQNSFVELTKEQKTELSSLLLNTKNLDQESVIRGLNNSRLLSNTAVEAILGTVKEDEKNAILKAIVQKDGVTRTEKELQQAMQDETVRRKAAAKILATETPEKVRKTLGQNVDASSRMTTGSSALYSGIAIAGMAGGGYFGKSAGSLFGDGGKTIGMSLGAIIGNAASSQIISSLASGAKLGTAFMSLGLPMGLALGALVVTGLIGAIENHKKEIRKKAVEVAKESAEDYTNALSASASALSFDKLVSGVDYLGRNISLTDEEYQQFLDSSNALAEAFPELVVRVDEFGNKLVGPDGLEGKVGTVTEKIDGMTESMKKGAATDFFKQTGSEFWGTEDAFGEVFSEQMDTIIKARNKLTGNGRSSKYEGVYINRKAYGINGEISLRKQDLDKIKEEEGIESENYIKVNKELQALIQQQDTYNQQISEATTELSSYNEQLMIYASTGLGKEEFGTDYGDLYDQYSKMSEEAQSAVSQIMSSVDYAPSFGNKEDEQAYKEQMLKMTQEMTNFFEQNPIAVDLYFGEGEFATLGAKANAAEQLIPILQEMFGSYFDAAEMEVVARLGLKVVVGEDGKQTLEVESIGETFSKKFEQELTQATVDKWSDFIGGLTQKQYGALNSLQEGGWLRAGSVYKPDILKKMIGADEYQTTDLQILSNRYLRKKGEGWWNENGQTDAGDAARSVTDKFMRDLSSNPDEGVSITDYLLDKKDIAEKFADYGQDWMERFDALQTQLADDIKGASPEEVQKAVNDFTKQIDLEAGLQEQINALAPLTEAAASQLFSSIDVEGYIDTWKELSDAFESIQKSYDDLAEAQAEQKQQGHLQVQTVLDLLSTDENYIQALEVEGEQIKLKSNAEEIMNEVKLRAIQLSLQQKIAEDELAKAQIESELRAAYAGDTYTKVADETVTATDNKITAFQAESDALAQVTNDYLTLAQAETLANKAKIATDVGAIAAVEKGISGFKSNTSVKSTQIKHVDKSQIDYSGMDDEERQTRINSLEAQLKNYAGNFTYDEKTGQFSYELDDQGHYTEGSLGVRQHLEQDLGNLLKKGASGTNFNKMYKSLAGSSKDAKDSVNDLLKALDSLIDKEWEAMEVWDEDNQRSTGYTAYFEKKRASLEKLAAVAKSKMDSAATEEERADAEKDYIDYQKQINNLDDEEIEDKYNLLELQGASLDKLIAMQKVYIQTSDTEEENVERNKKLKELLQDQLSLHREISEWQRDNTDRLIDRLSGDAFGNKAYDMAISQQIDAVTDEMNTTQNKINQYYAQAVEGYEKTGSTHAEALRLAYTGNSEASENLRSEMTKYYDLIDKRTEYTIKKLEDKADDLNRRMDLLEKEKPDQWFKIGDIDSYYTQRMDLLQNQIALYEDALKDTSDMTDEQIQNIVDSLNEATLNLKQAQIDNLKDQTDLQSTQYDAIVYRINLWKDEIQDAIDAIEKAYEDEIKPIQDVSDELERQAKLEDLLAAKKAAAKEKERVFREGEQKCPLKR